MSKMQETFDLIKIIEDYLKGEGVEKINYKMDNERRLVYIKIRYKEDPFQL